MKRLQYNAVAAFIFLATPALAFAASSPFGIATPDSPVGGGLRGPAAPFFLAAIHLQTLFYQKLTSILDRFSADPYAGFWLMGLSFLYGIFHAVGPGHGKAVISSFVLTTGERLRQATLMSVLASLLQAISAIVIVFVATQVFDATAAEITFATDSVEAGSYGLITILGLSLIYSKGSLFVRRLRGRQSFSGRFSCDGFGGGTVRSPESAGDGWSATRHGLDCGCLSAGLAIATREASRNDRLQALAAVGVRPCSGALIVLIFALSRGLAYAGVMSVFAMAVGTAFTVSLVAALSVLARGFLARVAVSRHWIWPRIAVGSQFVAACALFLFGIAMLTGVAVSDGFL